VIRYVRERLGKFTSSFRRGRTGDRDSQGVDGESADNEGDDESDFGEHDDVNGKE